MIKRLQGLLIGALLTFCAPLIYGQCPTASFSNAGPVCSGTPYTFQNTSTGGALSYQWDFCPGDFDQTPVTTTVASTVPGPRSFDLANDNGNLYGFSVNRDNGTLYRFDFGNSPDNTPATVDLGNPGGLLVGTISTNVQLYSEAGNWYGFMNNFSGSNLIQLNFGSSLSNVPTTSTIAYPYAFTGYQFSQLINDNGHVFIFTGNATTNTIFIADFQTSILNTPTFDTITVNNLPQVNQLKIVKSCDQWIGFGVSVDASSVIRLNFGSSLLNQPTQEILGNINSALLNPISLDVVNDGKWKVIIQNFALGTILADFGTDASGPLIGTSLAGIPNANYVSTYYQNSAYYLFIASVSTNLITLMKFDAPCNANPPVSNLADGTTTFSQGGSYSVLLRAFDANQNVAIGTGTVNVLSSPVADFSAANLCFGDQTAFTDLSTGTISQWNWDFGDGNSSVIQNPLTQYSAGGPFTVTLTTTASNGCADTLQKQININPKPTAGGTISTGCSRTLSQFDDLSTISSGSIVSYVWDFGNGDTSQSASGFYTYPNGGSFTVNHTVVSDSGCTASISINNVVQDRPLNDFVVTNTCVGLPVQFFDVTVVNGSTITSYAWDFGDGNNSSIANPINTYAGGPADFPVQLITQAANGCSDTLVRLIHVANIPSPDFSFDALVCQGGVTHFFDATTVAGGDTVAGWQWDFGDGGVSTDQNPTHVYSTSGAFTVSLTAYSPSSCGSIVYQQTINVTPTPTPSFIANVACVGSQTLFTNTTTIPSGQTTTNQWYFTATDSSSFPNPAFTFASAGNYNVTLTVTANTGCTSSIQEVVSVSAPPVVSFSYTNGCSSQSTQFTNTSTTDSSATLATYSWDFGDPASGVFNTSTLASPAHQFVTAGTYTVTLTVANNYGCQSTTIRNIVINNSPQVNFTYSPTCLGNQMIFANPGSPADSVYFWTFGDAQISYLREPAHYYAFAGTYNVTLTVYGFSGCTTAATRTVTVSPIPSANFSTPPPCENTAYTLLDSSSISAGSIVKRYWYVNAMLIDSSSVNATYTFPDTGTYSVRLTVKSDIGCTASKTKNLYVNPLPIANFTFNPQFGNPPLDVNFTDLSSGATAYAWDFGDGSGTSSLQNPDYTYLDTGLFAIRQIVISTVGCKDTTSKNIYIIKPILDLAIISDSSYYDGTFFHIVARIANLGTREITSAKIEASLDNGNSIREEITDLLPNGANGIRSYEFRASFRISSFSNFRYYCIKVSEPNGETDNVPANDEKCFNRNKKAPSISVYPNPVVTDCKIRIILPFADQLTVQLTDANGKNIQTLFEGNADQGLTEFNPDLSSLRQGVYTLTVRYNEENYYTQIIKMEVRK